MIELATPLALIALVAVPVLLYLYSLRPRRQHVVVSSTELWREVLAERQRGLGLRQLLKNLSLLLLLLAAAVLALSLSAPRWLTRGADAVDRVVIVDVSASMQAEHGTAVGRGDSHFEWARNAAAAHINDLASESRTLVIASGAAPRIATAFESDRTVLQRALSAFSVTDEAGDMPAALALAEKLLGGSHNAEVHVFTDGAFDLAPEQLSPRTTLHVSPEGATGNVAITRFSIRRVPGRDGEFEALIRVRNFTGSTRDVPLSLTVAGSEVWRGELRTPALSDALVVRPFRSISAGEATAAIDVVDALAVDNRAYAVIQVEEPVLATIFGARNFFLDAALGALAHIGTQRQTPDQLAAMTSESFAELAARTDVIVLDGINPQTPTATGDDASEAPVLPPGRYLLLNTVPPGSPLRVERQLRQATVTEVGDSALVAGLDMTAVDIARPLLLTPVEDSGAATGSNGATDGRFVYQPLLRTDAGVLAYAVAGPSHRIVALGFDPAQSSLPQRAAYPLLLERALGWLANRNLAPEQLSLPAGSLHSLSVAPGTRSVIVNTPTGTRIELAAENGTVQLDATSRTGIYAIESERNFGLIAVNLTNADESRLNPRVRQALNKVSAVSEERGQVAQSLWPWLAVLGLLALGAEWGLRVMGRAHA